MAQQAQQQRPPTAARQQAARQQQQQRQQQGAAWAAAWSTSAIQWSRAWRLASKWRLQQARCATSRCGEWPSLWRLASTCALGPQVSSRKLHCPGVYLAGADAQRETCVCRHSLAVSVFAGGPVWQRLCLRLPAAAVQRRMCPAQQPSPPVGPASSCRRRGRQCSRGSGAAAPSRGCVRALQRPGAAALHSPWSLFHLPRALFAAVRSASSSVFLAFPLDQRPCVCPLFSTASKHAPCLPCPCAR